MATNVTKKGKLKNIDVENNTETLMHPETSSDVVLLENVSNSTIPSDADNLTKLINKMGALAFKSSLSSSDVSGSGTVTSVTAGVGLTGGTITGSGTIKASLKSETALTNTAIASGNTANRTYAVAVDNSRNLAVNVPWTDTTYSAGTGITLSGTTINNSGVRSISSGSTNGTISVNTNGTNAEVSVKGLGSAAYTESTAYAPPVSVIPTIPFPTTKQLEIGKITVGSTTKTLYSPGVFTPPWRNDSNVPQAGCRGLVPGPGPDQENSFLRGDGTWDTIIESGTFTPSALHNGKETIMNSYRKDDGTTFETKAWYWRTGKLVYIRMYIVFDGNSLDSGKTYYVGSQITGLPYYTGNASSPFVADTSAGRLFVSAYTASHLVGGFNLQAWILENRIHLGSSRVGKIGNDYSQLNYNNIDNYLYRLDTTGDVQDNTEPVFKIQHPTVHISGVFPIKDADA